ncbi:Uma2 family endonuclease [Lusitaniella coriacea LEGE 07157]|uniref:Uma2 family endonuclease n=1 Tax=Lusitaniella coriacea LEGE 07157 TaxID=945747 RepID=A0A8J7DV79_9CYAN|nr:Uma2 family endonuclease [Lusitaniella coriacea]MBE9115611.1 Uma2 family endonuclease [Lusitaniella coriacea LEGE 07157]
MTTSPPRIVLPAPFPDHTQLPEENGEFVKNFQEHPQSILLTDSIGSVLQRLHPDGQYAVGQDCGIYWRQTDPPERGAESPDWFYVPRVPPKFDGDIRHSYVLWREFIAPSIALEFASGDGSEERDTTPISWDKSERTKPGKFWIYEQIMRIPYYGIYEIKTERLEVFRLAGGSYQPLEVNERGHYPIESMGVELGLWEGSYQNQTQRWLRWWDSEGNLLLTGGEWAEQAERERDEEAQARREAVPKLLGMGLTTEQVAEALSLPVEEVRRLNRE